ncbi:MAG: EamA family transporter [Acidobacteriota bacterium]|nr:EamA family transporter [Acidobacteriota bacterium]
MHRVSPGRAWLGFWVLTLIWGSSFLFIRIGVAELSTFQLVFIRTAIAAVGLNLVVAAQGRRLPSDRRGVRDVVFLGVVNTVVPFALITWGEKSIESGLAALLQATSALFTLVLAHFMFADERITPRKILGLLFGFAGVVVLASRSLGDDGPSMGPGHLLGQLAIVGASLCYAVGGTYSRRAMQRRLSPIVVAAGTMTVTAVITGVLAYLVPLLGGAPPTPIGELSTTVVAAVITLGVLNTFVAYLIFYSIIETLGAARASMVTYSIPAVGLALGTVFLAEPLDTRLLVGAVMIVGSIGIVNLRRGG